MSIDSKFELYSENKPIINPKQAGLFVDLYVRGGGWGRFVIEKKGGKNAKNLLKTLISAVFEHSYHRNRAFTRNATKYVADVIFSFFFTYSKLTGCSL